MARVQEHSGRGRINVRVGLEQQARIRAAAEASGESLTGFLLAAASERAEEVLERAGRVALQAAAFERFVAALDAPV
ncbi:MAG: type II toxin-antitoxin system TacA family antitoxin, partial [Actinomycetes bacterium]